MQQYQKKKTRKKPQVGLGLSRLGQKRMPWYTLLVICAAIMLCFFLIAQSMNQNIDYLSVRLEKAENLVFEKEREILRLTEQVRLAETDQFIANEARTKYGYLFPGEIRFVVTNPEVLGLPQQTPETTAP